VEFAIQFSDLLHAEFVLIATSKCSDAMIRIELTLRYLRNLTYTNYSYMYVLFSYFFFSDWFLSGCSCL